uniref:TTF-type domain-containing protein n=1 Tax=Latimeria chalumnae TaxID=7897 RepID=H2ZTL9_LATCH
IKNGPMQPKLSQYPQQKFRLKKRSFQYHWFEKHNWLEYSKKNAAFCFACRYLGLKNTKDSLLSNGFNNWKRALDSFREHEKAAVHKGSMLAWAAFRNSEVHGDVVQQLQAANENEIKERREYVRRIVTLRVCLSLLRKQGISFRGHDETEHSQNKVNFMECFNLLTKFDPFLQKITKRHLINEVILCCSEQVTFSIVSELKTSGIYAIMADEARDKHKEQLALCVRYVVTATGSVKEHFLGFCDLKSFSAESITESIQHCLRDNGLEDLQCVAQIYDGASVMSGATGGVQAKFQQYHPEAIYVHCYAHQLNLVLCHMCKAATDFFNTLENLYTFFSASLIHHKKFSDVQAQLGLKHSELVQLSDTLWSCQLRSVNALLTNFTAVIQCLSEIQSTTATGLLTKLCDLPMVCCLFMFHFLLGTTEGFHKVLQKENLDLAQAVDLKEAVYSALKNMRTNEMAKALYDKAKTFCTNNNIDIWEVEPTVRRKKQKRMDDFLVESTCDIREEISGLDNFRMKLFYPSLDRILSEIGQRFSSVNADLMKGVQACNPS